MDKKIVAKELIIIAKKLMAKTYPKGKYYKYISECCEKVFNGKSSESGILKAQGKYKEELQFSIEKWSRDDFSIIVRSEDWRKNGFHEGEQISAKSTEELIFKCEEALERRIIKHFDEHAEKKYQEAELLRKFPKRFKMFFYVEDRDAPEKNGKIVITGQPSSRSKNNFIEYELNVTSSTYKHPKYVWTFDKISYIPARDEWSYGRGAEKTEKSFGDSPKEKLQHILNWQAVHNDWEQKVSNIEVSFY